MATVTTRYRCPVTPDACPTSPRRGFCPVHEWERLVPERTFLAAELEEEAVDPAGDAVDEPAAGEATGHEAGGATGPPVRLALVLAGALVPVRDEGGAPTLLGRDAPDCAHVPELSALDQISRAHAELSWHAGRLLLTDTGSANGTYVDDERITGPTQIWPGNHRLRLARDVEVTLVALDEFGAPC
ncbi:FHA domain-containing protein [Streptomyces sp. NPDC058000]|uniref:FHA domain-containing protein n=1 Tax=Streptomyces sp. NPDC058000 TaxID=3346299 RepID=UPI0036DFF489